MMPGDFHDYMEGVAARIKRESSIHHSVRRLAFFSLMPHMKESAPLTWHSFVTEYWPLPGDESVSEKYEPEMDRELYEQMVKVHGLKLSKQRRTNNA